MTDRRRHDLSVIALSAGAVVLFVLSALVLAKLAFVGAPFLVAGVAGYVVMHRLFAFIAR